MAATKCTLSSFSVKPKSKRASKLIMPRQKNLPAKSYPEVVTCLPEAEVAFEGAKAWILQAETKQLVFFEFEVGMDLPEHSHTYPQWGFVLDGEMELKIDGKPRICKKGDEYLIPVGGKHSAKFFQKTRVIDFFSEKSRYKPKRTL
jgi:quercetin dioxygenase-like cupin family protein